MNNRADPSSRGHLPVRDWAILAAALLAAFALRIWLLGDQNVWWDEGLAIWAVRLGWGRMTMWTAADVHPPIYFWLLHAWVQFAGEGEFAARFISLICGMATVAATYPLGRALFGRRVALLGTLLLAFSRFHVWWSQEMRMYIVATLWGVLSLYAMVRWAQAEGWLGQDVPQRKRGLYGLLYVAATAAGLYTLYLFVTIVLIENVFFLLVLLRQATVGRLRTLWRWAASQLAVLALFLPWLAIALPRMRSWSVATAFDFGLFIRLYATLLTLGISTYIERYSWLVLPFFLIVAASAVFVVRWNGRSKVDTADTDERQAALLLGLFLIVPPLVVYALTRPRGLFYAPQVEARYLILFAPAFYLLLAWSISVLWHQARLLAYVAVAFVMAAFLWTLPTHYAGRYLRDEHQTMARIIAAYAEPGDAVILVAGSRYPIFGYYYERLPEGPFRPPVYALPKHALQIDQGNVEDELRPVAAAHSRLWLAEVNAAMEDEQGLVEKWLDGRYDRILGFGFDHNALSLFAPQGEVARVDPRNLAPQQPLSGALDSGGELLGFDLPTAEFRPQDTIHLALYYSSPISTTIVVHLVDEQGHVLVQRECELSAAVPMGRHAVNVTVHSHTPAGSYHFEIADAEKHVSFGPLRITATNPLPAARETAVAYSAQFGADIEFLGYQLVDAAGQSVNAVHPGEALTLDLYWRAAQKVDQDYTVFAHLVGQSFNPATNGPVWAGHDSQPVNGGYPTSQWFTDQTIVDRHSLTVDPHAPDGEYEGAPTGARCQWAADRQPYRTGPLSSGPALSTVG
jgi:4-amino-4-deoxy-L-arabinose transferase-like glycosyltransferase